jgi:hypothetical protein
MFSHSEPPPLLAVTKPVTSNPCLADSEVGSDRFRKKAGLHAGFSGGSEIGSFDCCVAPPPLPSAPER